MVFFMLLCLMVSALSLEIPNGAFGLLIYECGIMFPLPEVVHVVWKSGKLVTISSSGVNRL